MAKFVCMCVSCANDSDNELSNANVTRRVFFGNCFGSLLHSCLEHCDD